MLEYLDRTLYTIARMTGIAISDQLPAGESQGTKALPKVRVRPTNSDLGPTASVDTELCGFLLGLVYFNKDTKCGMQVGR